MTRRLLLASNNAGKLAEVRAFLGPLGFGVIGPRDEDISLEVDETGSTYEQNASLKAEGFRRLFDGVVLADDSGLEIDALAGRPGVRSARYAGPDATDAQRCRAVLDALDNTPWERRTARFVCVMAVAGLAPETLTFRGECDGRITLEPLGTDGFGYDPIFWYEAFGATFAQVGPERKAKVSHRTRALAATARFLAGYT